MSPLRREPLGEGTPRPGRGGGFGTGRWRNQTKTDGLPWGRDVGTTSPSDESGPGASPAGQRGREPQSRWALAGTTGEGSAPARGGAERRHVARNLRKLTEGSTKEQGGGGESEACFSRGY